jgi:hypothetical protein
MALIDIYALEVKTITILLFSEIYSRRYELSLQVRGDSMQAELNNSENTLSKRRRDK